MRLRCETKLGISAFAWTGRFEADDTGLLPFAKECGFEAVEIPMFLPSDLPVTRLRRALEANGLAGTVCAVLPEGVNPIDPNPERRRAAQLHLQACVDAAAEMGAVVIGGPLYAPIGYLPPHRPTGDEKKWAAEVFQSVTPSLESYGMTLCLEPVNRSETFFVRTSAEAAALCAAIGHPRVGVTIDTFHANIEEKDISQAVVSLGAQLHHVHASENDRGVLGSVHVDFGSLLNSLARIDYQGYVIVEGFGFSASERSTPGTLWADTAISPEVLARESYAHLTRLLAEMGALAKSCIGL